MFTPLYSMPISRIKRDLTINGNKVVVRAFADDHIKLSDIF